MLDKRITEHQRIRIDYENGITSRSSVKRQLAVLIEKCENDKNSPNSNQTSKVGLKDLIELCVQNIRDMDGDKNEIDSATGPATKT
ncbi:hypothetical protein [Janthinobacterium lividum]|uniref:hypothetical protein n=1 Tax=Janthinobacterium lividum TaxID=29581 RepID=UPI001114548C|nr:hypothetical protein [Janthinobacterium lividum]